MLGLQASIWSQWLFYTGAKGFKLRSSYLYSKHSHPPNLQDFHFTFWDRAWLRSFGCTRPLRVDQVGLELKVLPASAFPLPSFRCPTPISPTPSIFSFVALESQLVFVLALLKTSGNPKSCMVDNGSIELYLQPSGYHFLNWGTQEPMTQRLKNLSILPPKNQLPNTARHFSNLN